MVKVGIINVTGYAGMELARILSRHPEATIASVTGRSLAGKRLSDVLPHLAGLDMTITEEVTGSVDVVFSALPHQASAQKIASFLGKGVKAVDISADFRLKSLQEYKEWYHADHPCPERLEEAVYGLPELNRKEISSAALVANPGCYPTASILALAPAIKAGIIEPDVIIDAKSGVSGAGQKAELGYLFSEVNENFRAYSVDGHRHMPEIRQGLQAVSAGAKVDVTFMPHLVPMTRGILATCYAKLRPGSVGQGEKAAVDIRDLYNSFYKNERFVQVAGAPPATKQTLGANTCVVYPTLDPRANRLIVISCIDNLVKGAAGQAVQNMNLMFGLEESAGLRQLALYP
ncbi:MAG: N-acetyl-gamma-glutamyl-phosphate reductase [SAR202 cluster bacterium]|nr:N-acetyl-gamma-glutamyl-phosphate reductase [SAR202 cluster bacterium]